MNTLKIERKINIKINSIMGGGILPIAIKDNKYYVLLGRESMDMQWRDSGKWSDFGGSKENKETEYETAIREGAEETCGIYGDKKNIKYIIDNYCYDVMKLKNYSTFLVHVNYNSMLPYKFNKTYRDALKRTPQLVYDDNGLYEKDKIRWVCVDDLNTFLKHSRFWFRPVITQIYNKYRTKI